MIVIFFPKDINDYINKNALYHVNYFVELNKRNICIHFILFTDDEFKNIKKI